jgi:hypothetical protein
MLMKIEEKRRLSILRKDILSKPEFERLYGIPYSEMEIIKEDDAILFRLINDALRTGTALFLRNKPIPEGFVSRFAFERALEKNKISLIRNAAISIGISEDDFRKVLEKMSQKMVIGNSFVYDSAIEILKNMTQDSYTTIFGNHSELCKEIHKKIKTYYKITVSPIICEVAKKKGEDYLANSFCAISRIPTSIKYQVMMKFGKPLQLRPDTCSALTVLRFKKILQPFTWG